MSKKVVPLRDRILVIPETEIKQTASGIYIPDSAAESPNQGVVYAVGPGIDGKPLNVKEGDTVMYGKYVGIEMQVDNQKMLFMSESDILAVLIE